MTTTTTGDTDMTDLPTTMTPPLDGTDDPSDVAALRHLHLTTRVPDPRQVGLLGRGGNKDLRKVLCRDCHQWQYPDHVHLDYMGHAEVRDTLLSHDPLWNWEPLASNDDGLPVVKINNGTASMWIKLTVHGLTRLGVGTASSSKEEVLKELIGDAIRNAAMSFGIAVTLWSKAEGVERAIPDAIDTTVSDGPVVGAGTGPVDQAADNMGGSEPVDDGATPTRQQVADMAKPELVRRLTDAGLATNGDLRSLKRRLWAHLCPPDGQPAQDTPSDPPAPQAAAQDAEDADPATDAPDDGPDPDPVTPPADDPQAGDDAGDDDEEQPPTSAQIETMTAKELDPWLRGCELALTGKVADKRTRLDDYLWGPDGIMHNGHGGEENVQAVDDDPAAAPFDDDAGTDATPPPDDEDVVCLNRPSDDPEEMAEMQDLVNQMRDTVRGLDQAQARAWASYRREKALGRAETMGWDAIAAAMVFLGDLTATADA